MIGLLAATTHTTESSSTVAIVAIIAGAAAAILGPAVGGYFLWSSTGRTIKAEHQRLVATLEAEDRRLREQLSFQRGETDRAELRGILDAVTEQFLAMNDAVEEGRTQWGVKGLLSTEPVAAENWKREARELSERIIDARSAVGDQVERLRLRLGAGGENLVRFVSDARQCSFDIAYSLNGVIGAASPEWVSASGRHIDELRGKFIYEARRFTEAQLYSSAEPAQASPSPS